MSRGVVKFFNATKGFGFIAPDDGAPDIFVHVSALHDSGIDGLNEGDEVSFETERDRRSGKASAVALSVIASAPPGSGRGHGGGGRFERPSRPAGRGPSRAAVGSGSGVVKWFNATKGFGFIQPSDGGDRVSASPDRGGTRSA